MPEKKRRPRKITNCKTFEAAMWTALDPYAAELEEAWKAMRKQHPRGRPPIQNRPVRREDALLRVFQAFREVTASFDTLCNVPFYMSAIPVSVSRRAAAPVSNGFNALSKTKSAWVRYHVENYLNELYIFQNRAKAFFTLLRRTYRKDTESDEVNRQCDRLEEALKEGFKGVVAARGIHVHQSRFDDTLLSTLELAELKSRLEKRYPRGYTDWLKEALDEKKSWMQRTNTAVRKWLNESGFLLGKLLFKDDGSFWFPSPPSKGSTQSPAATA